MFQRTSKRDADHKPSVNCGFLPGRVSFFYFAGGVYGVGCVVNFSVRSVVRLGIQPPVKKLETVKGDNYEKQQSRI